MSKMPKGQNEKIFQIAADALMTYKNDDVPLIIDVIMLAIPAIDKDMKDKLVGRGQCAMLPDGLPLLKKVSLANLQKLLEKLDSASKTFKDDEQAVKVACKSSPKKALPKVGAKAKGLKQVKEASLYGKDG